MIRGFTEADGSALFGLFAEGAGDILLKLDANGFISEASPGLECLGIDNSEMLFAPHVADLAAGGHVQRVRNYWSDAISGMASTERVEFPICQGQGSKLLECWHALTMRPVLDASGKVSGAIGIMRAVEPRRALEDELLAAAMTDPLTGLGNRHAFQSLLSRQLANREAGTVILFGIDRFRAIILRYGQSKGDEVLWAFAQFLRAILGDDLALTRMEGERFAAIMPDAAPPAARIIADEAVATFARLARESGPERLPMSASAGIVPISGDHDEVLANAELALTLAQAAGGQRAELRDNAPSVLCRRKIA